MDFFRRREIGLQAWLQVWMDDAGLTPRQRDIQVRQLRAAIRAYVLSGFPILVFTDLRRMRGYGATRKCVFESNKLPPAVCSYIPSNAEARHEPSRHCVVVVGCHQDRDNQYVIHDPATYPFLEIDFEQLLDVRRYSPKRAGQIGRF